MPPLAMKSLRPLILAAAVGLATAPGLLADGFIIIAAEYNRGYTAVLKNAIDFVYKEWNNKPVGFVAYGAVGGARAVEQLRLVAIEMQMAPVRQAVHLPIDLYMSMMNEEAPVSPISRITIKATKELTMNTSPWAKFTMPMMP